MHSFLLYGKNSVYERLKTNPKSIRKLFLEDNFCDTDIEKLIKNKSIPTEFLSKVKLTKIKPYDNLQGVIADIGDFQYTSLLNLLNRPSQNQVTLIFLDRIFDPQNLGAIIRTCACFGNFAIVIPKFKACKINETVIHVASGGENYVPVALVSNISNAITQAKDKGYWIMGAVVENDALDISKSQFLFPLGLVLGSEGKGIRYGIDKRLDIKIRIPMSGSKLSFNVAMACAIFCHEIDKQRIILDKNKTLGKIL